MISVQYVEAKTLGKPLRDQVMDFGEEIAKHLLGRKGGENNQTTERRRAMIKRLVVLCCILLLPTIAAAEGTTNYGDFWVGGQVGAVFTPNTDVTFTSPLFPGLEAITALKTNPAFSAGAIIGYNFCMPYRPALGKVFRRGSGLPMEPIQPPRARLHGCDFGKINGNQFALSFLGRLQYPFMGSERFTRGRIVPFLMFGPSVVWSTADFY